MHIGIEAGILTVRAFLFPCRRAQMYGNVVGFS